jgi:hypothetical protein
MGEDAEVIGRGNADPRIAMIDAKGRVGGVMGACGQQAEGSRGNHVVARAEGELNKDFREFSALLEARRVDFLGARSQQFLRQDGG